MAVKTRCVIWNRSSLLTFELSYRHYLSSSATARMPVDHKRKNLTYHTDRRSHRSPVQYDYTHQLMPMGPISLMRMYRAMIIVILHSDLSRMRPIKVSSCARLMVDRCAVLYSSNYVLLRFETERFQRLNS